MPTYPHTQSYLNDMRGRPFSRFSSQIEKMGVPTYPLHIGDTYLEPFLGARIEDVLLSDHPSSHKYISPKGHPDLIKALAEEYDTPKEMIQITPGATGGLHILALTFLSPGDEVLILAPYWPLASGIIRAVGAIPICVPFYDKKASIAQRITPYLSSKTVALYYNSPNNPTGLMLPSSQVEELAQFCRTNNLWVFSDEVYERLIFSGESTPIRTFAPERTLSLFSFSKAYAMAGYRCGFLLLPSSDTAIKVNKAMVHTYYSVSTPAQIAAVHVLKYGKKWLEDTTLAYHKTARECAEILNVPKPVGGTFLFFDISSYLHGRKFDDILLSCIHNKLLLAPGSAFGDGYENYIRVCFTSVQPDIAVQGIKVLADILEI